MRLYEVEYSKDELAQIREELRREYPHLTEEQLDEILPLIPLALGTVARAGVGMAARGAMGLGKLAAKGVGAAARGLGKAAKGVGGAIHQAGSSLANVGKKQIKKHILSQKDKKSEHGWNEILVNQIKIKDVFLLKRSDYPKVRKAAEKIATGQLTVGSPAKFRK